MNQGYNLWIFSFNSVSLMSLSQDDPMDTTQESSPHSILSNHSDSHSEEIYPSPPPSPNSSLTSPSNGDSSSPVTPLRQEGADPNLVMSPPWSPPSLAFAVPVTGPIGPAIFNTHSTNPMPHNQLENERRTFATAVSIHPQPIPLSSHSDGATMIMSGGAISSEKIYSKDDTDVIIELTKLVDAHPQEIHNLAKLLIPEKLLTLTSNGLVYHILDALKEEFKSCNRQLKLRNFFRYLYHTKIKFFRHYALCHLELECYEKVE